jgi:hypothetical protein
MMSDEHWLTVLARITPLRPTDLDVAVFGETTPPYRAWATDAERSGIAASARLWERPENEWSTMGVRILSPLADPAGLALRLASAALERRVEPIILTTLHTCGLEQFGFRVEKLAAGSEARLARQESELVRFWALAIVVDAADVVAN